MDTFIPEYKRWFSGRAILGKSVQKVYNFTVNIYHSGARDLLIAGPMPNIEEWHVVDVTVPAAYSVKSINQQYGPVTKSFPIMHQKEPHNIGITFEEDDQGTIAAFISWCQKKIVQANGLHNAPNQMKIDSIVITATDDRGVPIIIYTIPNAYFVKAEDANYSYDSGSAVIRYGITFAADLLQVFMPKQLIALPKLF